MKRIAQHRICGAGQLDHPAVHFHVDAPDLGASIMVVRVSGASGMVVELLSFRALP